MDAQRVAVGTQIGWRRLVSTTVLAALISGPTGCATTVSPSTPTGPDGTSTAPSDAPRATRKVGISSRPVVTGEPIDLASLSGRIVFDDFDDIYAMDVNGANVTTVAGDPDGPEFDGAWSPDGQWIVYRDSTRGINTNDEIFLARADGTARRNLSAHPANDWGPDWSPDGSTIAFNSDRDGQLQGFLVNPDGSNLRPIEVDAWLEYPSFSPDGRQIAFMSHDGGDYDIYVAEIATGTTRPLTDAGGSDGWPAWSPDGHTIAFTSERDACTLRPPDEDCWTTGDDGDHHDIWLVDVESGDERRVTTEHGQFVAWSPDGRDLLVSGYALYVIRPDGTGRIELRADGVDHPLGGIPDWR